MCFAGSDVGQSPLLTLSASTLSYVGEGDEKVESTIVNTGADADRLASVTAGRQLVALMDRQQNRVRVAALRPVIAQAHDDASTSVRRSFRYFTQSQQNDAAMEQ